MKNFMGLPKASQDKIMNDYARKNNVCNECFKEIKDNKCVRCGKIC